MRYHPSLIFLIGSACLSCSVAQAQTKPKSGKTPQVKFTQYKLANGLRIVLAPDSSAPVIAVSVTYDVGSRNEREGRTGFAHLFEHMMFQGSTNVGKGEHFVLINDNGGSFNGTTNSDRTNYFETLPSNQIDLALFLEADRMRGLDITQQNLDNQRAVVQEERRQSYDNQPYGKSREMMSQLAYKNFAYSHSTIGSMADLNAATLDDVKQFFKINYAPNNAVLALTGDFKINDAKAKIQKYFGSIPSQPAPPKVDATEPESRDEQRKTIVDPLARLTRVDIAFKTVPGDDPDYYALSMLGSILSRGRTGRLYSALVEKNLAMNANGSQQESRGPGLFTFGAMVPPTGDPKLVEKAIYDAIEQIQKDGVTGEEMSKAQVSARAGAFMRMGTALGKANSLSQNSVFYNDPGRMNNLVDRLQLVTSSDVQRVAKKYLNKSNRVVIITEPVDDGGGFNP